MTEVGQFRELGVLLATLKIRSGRTYEALARRIGISRSALHRYCSGQGVPSDFVTLERLGRACGANRAELADLHRRWGLAIAAREASTERTVRPRRDDPPDGHGALDAPGPIAMAL
jgi:transcriptional regulator with XRE-family HTH domain